MAAIPLWYIMPGGGSQPNQQVYRFGSINISYVVQNNSRNRTFTIAMAPIPGVSVMQYRKAVCKADQQYVRFLLQGANPLQCYQPVKTNSLRITITDVAPVTTINASASVADLVLTTNGIFTAASGAPQLPAKARTLTITNTGQNTALNVQYSVSPSLPVGTSISPASCGDIAPAAACVLTITPGSTPTAEANQAVVTSVIRFQGSNTLPISSNISVLTYGNIYQGGFVFAIDDSTAVSTSVAGKVVGQTDQSNGIVWSTNNANIVPGINYDSTPVLPSPVLPPPPPTYVGCNGSFDGACNSSNLRLFFTAQGLPSNQYAAGLCDATINGYSDWYLPAMCELGYGRQLCGTFNPTEQNVNSNILELYYGTTLVNFANLAFSDIGVYWSSSTIENPSTPGQYNPYYVYFYELAPPPGGAATSDQGNDQVQTIANHVRCVRKF